MPAPLRSRLPLRRSRAAIPLAALALVFAAFPATAAPRAPLAAFSSPGSGPLRALAGSVADGSDGVEVAVALRAGRRCRALTSARPSFAAGATACQPRRWQRAQLDDGSWRLRFERALPRGRYRAWVRAVAPGTRPWPFSTEGGNEIVFALTR